MRSRRLFESIVNSAVQVAERQATVTTPSRSKTGSASAATPSPTASRHRPWTCASRVGGASSGLRRPSAAASGRSPSGRREREPRSAIDDSGPHLQRRCPIITDRSGIGCRDQRLALLPHQLEQPLAALGVELAQDVVEQQDRQPATCLREGIALGQQEREQREPLLPLRAEATQVLTRGSEQELVAVGAVGREASGEIM